MTGATSLVVVLVILVHKLRFLFMVLSIIFIQKTELGFTSARANALEFLQSINFLAERTRALVRLGQVYPLTLTLNARAALISLINLN